MGMGIAWDQEMPPTYDDVPVGPPSYEPYKMPPSPPGYRHGSVGEFDAASLRALDVEQGIEQGLEYFDMRRELPSRFSAADLEHEPVARPSNSQPDTVEEDEFDEAAARRPSHSGAVSETNGSA